MDLDRANLLACAQACLSAIREADVACDALDQDDRDQARARAEAAQAASQRARRMLKQVVQRLPSHSRQARLARAAVEATETAIEGSSGAVETDVLDSRLGRAQRAVVAVFDCLGEPRPPVPVRQGPAAQLPRPPLSASR
jgi:hypothetical protein